MIVVWFLVLIGPLIFIHELGHFAFAKLFKVKVLQFSLGFGPAIKGLHWTWGETEYKVAYVPLGGYVKMLGEDPTAEIAPEDQGRALQHKPLWQKYLIVTAGPLFNLVFPVLVYFFYFLAQSTAAPAVIGTVIPGEPAATAGLRSGDRVLAIDGHKIRYWTDVTKIIQGKPNQRVRLVIEREGSRLALDATPRLELQRTRLGVVDKVGLLGIMPAMTAAQVGVIDPNSPAGRAGIRTGDWVLSVNGRPTPYWHQLRSFLKHLKRPAVLHVFFLRAIRPAGSMGLSLWRPGTVDLRPNLIDGRVETGLRSAEMFVSHVDPATPAFRMGLRPGDFVLTLDGQELRSWLVLANLLSQKRDKAMTITWQSPGGPLHRGTVRLERKHVVDEFKQERTVYVFGATNGMVYRYPPKEPIDGRFVYAVHMAALMSSEVISDMVLAVVQIFRGKVASDTVGGPIMLANIAKVAASKGWDVFLWIMALISINLGLLNLLPVPILDGGHVLIFTIEAVRRKPLSLQARAAVSYLGLALLLALMVLAFKNDIVRYILN
ncbi:MAG: RIP metalloprotease RseP [Deltaproteobacteria bacterium]|nr:RIP metalloprotease RseP [Deltaproteobacteria bacterium]